MIAPLESKIISSFMLMVDHVVQQAGVAYENHSGRFYPVQTDLAGYYAYAAPFKQLCNDTSVSGANVLSGLYINGGYNPIGSGHLKMFNHYKGVAYFDQSYPASTTISGNYAIKDFSIELSDQPEWRLLFETQYYSRSKYNQTLSGIDPTFKTTPVIFITNQSAHNEGWGFGHIDNQVMNLRCVIISDNEHQSVGASSILKNTFLHYLPMVTGLPFDAIGNTTGALYNYKTAPQDSTYAVLIKDARSIDVPQKGDFKSQSYKNYSFVDVELSTIVQNSNSLP